MGAMVTLPFVKIDGRSPPRRVLNRLESPDSGNFVPGTE